MLQLTCSQVSAGTGTTWLSVIVSQTSSPESLAELKVNRCGTRCSLWVTWYLRWIYHLRRNIAHYNFSHLQRRVGMCVSRASCFLGCFWNSAIYAPPIASLGRKGIIKALLSLNTEVSGSGSPILHFHLCWWSCSMYGHSGILPAVTGELCLHWKQGKWKGKLNTPTAAGPSLL